jgi:hypothetical protein
VTTSLVFLAFLVGCLTTLALAGLGWLAIVWSQSQATEAQAGDVGGGGIHQDPDAEWVEGKRAMGFRAT